MLYPEFADRVRCGRAPGLRVFGAVLGLAALSGCEADTFYDGGATGPNLSGARHTVAIEMSAPARVEMTDSIRVTIRANEAEGGSGIKEIGATILVRNATTGDLRVIPLRAVFDSPQPGTVERVFSFAPPVSDRLGLPTTLNIEAHGFAVNGTGACAAAVETTPQRLACGSLEGQPVALESTGLRGQTLVTVGRTFVFPREGTIADALVQVAGRPRLYLSNITAHTVEVLDLQSFDWREVRVGSRPWGLALDRSGGTLMVANSGGTSISYVSTAGLNEVGRLQTPNTLVFEVTTVKDTLGIPRYKASFFDFSDRPQFMAEDANGFLLYSTVPTAAGPLGTIRYAERRDGWASPEVRLLFTGNAISPNPNVFAIANVDSLRVVAGSVDSPDQIVAYDHVPGFPGQFIKSAPKPLVDALLEIRALGSDVFFERGNWDPSELGLSDTTFVSVSENRQKVAFGEGAVGPAGRIIMWDAARRDVSSEISVKDLVNNASERVLGVDLNQDGSFGVARGQNAAYFFNDGLRLQGMFSQGLEGSGGGAALRPHSSGVNTLAFVGTANRSIQIIDTSHFMGGGEVPIRDAVTGPLRAAPALPGQNAGLSCPGDPKCVVVNLYGVTSRGGVVVVDVREGDLRR